MPEFSRFREGESRSAGEGFGGGFDNGNDDGFANDFDSDSDDGFLSDTSDRFLNKEKEGYPPSPVQPEKPLKTEHAGKENKPVGRSQKNRREGTVDLKSAFHTLFQGASGRLSDGDMPARDAGVDSPDASYANDFDSAVDDVYVPGQDFIGSDGKFRRRNPAQNVAGEPYLNGYSERVRNEEMPEHQHGESGRPDRDFRSGEPAQPRYDTNGSDGFRRIPAAYRRDHDDHYDHAGRMNHHDIFTDSDNSEQKRNPGANNGEEAEKSTVGQPVEAVDAPEGTAGGVLAAIGASLRKLRKRLPSFRPKVYALPEPEYTPEDDGIAAPTLVTDIQRMLEEQNKPGETEQEYDRMRSYISSVSTDARIRPGDIKAPENIGEVRAAESELYDLIDNMINTNEQQRSQIGVYETPQEEDPYNYRGINNDRQYYSDMDVYSFNMNPRYGFESEERIDPRRKFAEIENRGGLKEQVPLQARPENSRPFPEDDMNDGYLDSFDGGSSSLGGGVDIPDNALAMADGRSDMAPGNNRVQEDRALEDDFGDSDDGGSHGAADGDFDLGDLDESDGAGFLDNAFDDYFTAGFDEARAGRGSRASGRHYENPDPNAAYDEGFVDYRTKRSGERKPHHRRGDR